MQEHECDGIAYDPSNADEHPLKPSALSHSRILTSIPKHICLYMFICQCALTLLTSTACFSPLADLAPFTVQQPSGTPPTCDYYYVHLPHAVGLA